MERNRKAKDKLRAVGVECWQCKTPASDIYDALKGLLGLPDEP